MHVFCSFQPLLFEVMDDWISVLLRETKTVKVPEGLDRYYTEKEYEVPPEDLLDQDEDPDDPYSCIKDIVSCFQAYIYIKCFKM